MERFKRVKVKRAGNGRQWNVLVHGVLVEGGFFSHDAAVRCAEYWQKHYMGDQRPSHGE